MISSIIPMRELRCRKPGPCQGQASGKQWNWAGQSGFMQVCCIWGEDKTDLGPLGETEGFGNPDRESRGPQMWEGPDKWGPPSGGLCESSKNYSLHPPKGLSILSLSLTHADAHPQKHVSQAEFS